MEEDPPAALVWEAVRDVGAVHRRLARDFVTSTELEPRMRIVTFANGFVARELIVSVDDRRRRVAYSVVNIGAEHHHASMEVVEHGNGSRLVWITDFLPDSLAAQLAPMIEQGAEAMRRTLNDAG